MVIFGLVFLIITISVAGLATGVLLGRAPLRGSCGAGVCTRAVKCPGCHRNTEPGKDT